MFSDPALAAKYDACPPALQRIIAEFQDATPAERVDLMVEYAETLPDLPADLHGRRDAMEQVHECQSPVFLFTRVTGDVVHFDFDIPRESPTVRGYASILVEGLHGASSAAVLNTPDDVYRLLGLHEAISHLRLRGLHALLGYMKRQVVAALAA